jgi:very-short-patch-repair endonuclease
LPPADLTTRCGLPLTTPLRTCFDLIRRPPLVEAVVAADAILHAGLGTQDGLQTYIEARAPAPAVRQAREVASVAEPRTESPMESRLRMVLILGGLPRPRVQEALVDPTGRVVARLDLAYPTARLGIEYDGATHRETLAEDNRRQNLLLCEFGLTLLRYTALDVYNRPETIVADVRSVLARRGIKTPVARKRRLERPRGRRN